MTDLYLPLKAEYFAQIVSGAKKEEFRLATPFWRKRLEGKTFDAVVVSLGYPSRDDAEKRSRRAWRGYKMKNIVHPHFGEFPVDVFAIDVSELQ